MKPRKWDVIVLGGINSDYLIRGPRLPEGGHTVQGDEFLSAAGGKGSNQAVAAARLGAKVGLISKVGMDSRGDDLIRVLRREKIETRWIFRDPKAASGAALVMVGATGEKQIMTAPGANLRLSAAEVRDAKAALEQCKVLLIQFEAKMEVLLQAVRLAKKAGALIVLDPAPPCPKAEQILEWIDVIRPNANEAEMLTGIPCNDASSARNAAKELMERGVKIVSVQAGEEGDLLVWPEGERLFRRLPVKSIDATGAGDAFAAALAVSFAQGRTPQEAGAWANAAAALATTKFGAQTGLPTAEQVARLVNRTRKKSYAS